MNTAKRVVDVVVACCGLMALSPLLVLVAASIRLSLGSPVLFRQQRPGLHGREFTMLKFRTMKHAVDASGTVLRDEDRLTFLGRFLRGASLDELPGLYNVLRGDMSLVGPRPLLMQYLNRYTPEQARRHEVKPGITGWAQVNGRNAIDWEKKFELDVWYVDNWSLLLDLKILLMTVWKVLGRKDISAAKHVTMPEFMGAAAKEGELQG